MKEQIMKLSMKDTARNSKIALPIIAFFELLLITRWLMLANGHASVGKIFHLVGYVSLLVASIALLVTIFVLEKRTDKIHRYLNVLQSIYAVLIVSWAVFFTLVDAKYNGHFDYLIFITIITIVPIFCFIRPLMWMLLQLAASAVVFYLAADFPRYKAFAINFAVFTIISIVAGWSIYKVRYSAYQRMIELQKERDLSHEYAYSDTLTKLPNRRSYREDVQKLQSGALPANLILAMFDVNGLKKVNDGLGHEAGDELIHSAGQCMVQAFGGMGSIYRVGGDEFTGVLYGSPEELTAAKEHFTEVMAAWKGNLVPTMSISIGTASVAEYPNMTIAEMEVVADNAMYAAKQAHYAKFGK